MKFDRRELDDFDPVSQEKLRDACSGNDQKVYVRTVLLYASNDSQSPESMTQSDRIMRVVHNSLKIRHVTPLYSLLPMEVKMSCLS